MTMKLTTVMLFMAIPSLMAVEVYSQATRMTMQLNDASVREVLNEIEENSEFFFLYNSKLVDVDRKVTVDVNNKQISEVLTDLFRETDVVYSVVDRQIVLTNKDNQILLMGKASETNPILQQKQISGRVTGADKVPLPGVSVVVKGTSKGTITDASGQYSMTVLPDEKILVFSFIGMRSKEVLIETGEFAEVTLAEAAVNLDDIIVVGYMTQKKADLTGSISIVDDTNLKENSYPDVLRTIQGKVPGVYIVSDGGPASNSSIQIRGITSVNASNPLLIIDGVASNINFKDLNPNDIQSMQILKDAASASIYGARAAGGVILIETKKGKNGELSINYDFKAGISYANQYPDVCNSEEYATAQWRAYVYDNQIPSGIYDYEWHYDDNGIPVLDDITTVDFLDDEQLLRPGDTDWLGAILKPAFQQSHQITVTQGTDKSNTMISLNYLSDNGIILNSYNYKYSARINSSFNLLDGKIRVGENLNLIHTISRGDFGWTFFNALVTPPNAPVYDINGNFAGLSIKYGQSFYFSNPVEYLVTGKDDNTKNNMMIGSINAEVDILKGLYFRTQYGLDYSNGFNRYLDRNTALTGGAADGYNAVSVYSDYSTSWIWTNTLNYSLTSKNHNLNAVAGIEMYKYKTEDLSGNRRDLMLENYAYAFINTATGEQTMSNFGDESSLLSYFAKINYALKNKYLLSLTGRLDGSSRFPEANQFGFFPAVSAGWRISEEEFMNAVPILSNLKLRASWGVNGNSNIPSNGTTTTFVADYVYASYMIDGSPSGLMPSGFLNAHRGNPYLRWESTTQTDLGIDFGIFNDRLTGSIDLYNKRTTDMLFEPAANPVYGEGARMWINAAEMINKGLEAMITYSSDPMNEFTYEATVNLSLFRNKVDKIPEDLELQFGGNGLEDNILGRPLRSIYGFVAEGVFNTQEEVDTAPEQEGKGLGRLRYKDLDGDGKITYEHDQTWIGNYDPDFMLGFNFNAAYKGFDFSMFWQGLFGQNVFNDWLQESDFMSLRNVWMRNKDKSILDAWFYDNTDSDKPALSFLNTNDEGRMSTYFLQNGSYLKLRSIELGYTLPQSVVGKTGLKHLRVYVSAQNMINIYKRWGDDAFTGWDSEMSGFTATFISDEYGKEGQNYMQSYPRPAIINIGINSTF
jgi:TonB-linked SusC/RagA family outer membrane protein